MPVGFKTQAGETFHQVCVACRMLSLRCSADTNVSGTCRDGAPTSCRYRRFGRMLQKRTDFEHVFVLNKHPDFRRDTGLRWRQLKSFRNGGTVVELLQLVRR